MEAPKLAAQRRTVVGKRVGQLRRSGNLPAVLYGPGVDAMAIQVNTREATRMFRHVHGAELIDLDVDGDTRKVLLHNLQRDAIRGDLLHADFYAVDMTRPIKVHVPIRLVGSSFAVNSLSGVLVRGVAGVEVECLPGDLITVIETDLGELKEIGSAINVRDLHVPPAVTILTDPDELVARVTFQAKEEDLTAPIGGADEVEVIDKGADEEDEEE
jgi:large subunit ribosomal protein L25